MHPSLEKGGGDGWPGLNQLFVTLVIADPEPQKSVSSFQSESAIVQSDSRGPDFLPSGFSGFLENVARDTAD
jgi:hypothetical protein